MAEQVRVIVREEISGVEAKVGGLETDVRDLGVKFEHFDAKMDAIAELVTTTVQTRREVSDLGPHVEILESQGAIQKRVIQEHSQALKQLRGEA
ncbi:MAG TPA: hypothetical protein VMT30_01835 [Candidatus Saccharimonadia bacterium]|nr:hypothetical protein [Candidatus Saccharimonadia bacterium]